MKIGVISDIHGNLEAFRAVLEDMDGQELDEIVCLGDNVGYGPEPELVVRLLRDRGIPSVMGNHELVLAQPRYLKKMNPKPRKSALLTQELISSDTVSYLVSLPSFLMVHGARFVHGCPPDSPTIYLFQVSETRFRRLFRSMDETICFAGHTHDLEVISFDGNINQREPLGRDMFPLEKDRQYIINVGSVGQPRDGNNNAKYVLWDTSRKTVQARYVPYDIGATAQKILALGFPEYNADRLW